MTDARSSAPPLAGPEPLIEVHAHFHHPSGGRTTWKELNASRFRAGARIGISCHVGSILGTWGHRSPIYFPSPEDVSTGNDAMFELAAAHRDMLRAYIVVNPNYTDHAVRELERGRARGGVGVKLLASRRAGDPLLDPIMEEARRLRYPVLHHVWQHRTRYWPGQDASDARDLARLASRHPNVPIILAHIGGGGDYMHTFAVVRDVPSILLDISGSGVDRGMLDLALETVGPERMLWGSDVTMETGLAKLRALEVIGLNASDLSAVRWRNAKRIFPSHAFPMLETGAATNAVPA